VRKILDYIGIAIGIAALAYLIGHPEFKDTIKPAQAQVTIPGPTTTALTVGTGATMAAIPAIPTVRALCIANGNATAANVVTATWGTVTPVDGTTGLVIPGGQVAASTWCAPSIIGNFWAMLQLNLIAHVGATPVTVLQW